MQFNAFQYSPKQFNAVQCVCSHMNFMAFALSLSICVEFKFFHFNLCVDFKPQGAMANKSSTIARGTILTKSLYRYTCSPLSVQIFPNLSMLTLHSMGPQAPPCCQISGKYSLSVWPPAVFTAT